MSIAKRIALLIVFLLALVAVAERWNDWVEDTDLITEAQ